MSRPCKKCGDVAVERDWHELCITCYSDSKVPIAGLVEIFKHKESVERDVDCNSIISNPPHYTQGAIQPIDFITANKMDFREGSIVKYVCRYKFKGTPLRDLLKARQYLDWLIKEEEEKSEA